MSYKIVGDSSCEYTESLRNDPCFVRVPLGLEVGDYRIMDDETFNQAEFLAQVAASPVCPKSSCPSPERFMNAYDCDADMVFSVTLSSKLSGSYNSAVLGAELFKEENEEKNILAVDSKSAVCGESEVAEKLQELCRAGLSFDEITKQITDFVNNMNTYFVLDNLDTLRKNGRLSGVKALVATTLSIKPIMGSDDGSIVQKGQAMGIKKALSRMTDYVVSEATDSEQKIAYVAHVNCPDRAEFCKNLLSEKGTFKDIRITAASGLSSMYANDGGIIVAV